MGVLAGEEERQDSERFFRGFIECGSESTHIGVWICTQPLRWVAVLVQRNERVPPVYTTRGPQPLWKETNSTFLNIRQKEPQLRRKKLSLWCYPTVLQSSDPKDGLIRPERPTQKDNGASPSKAPLDPAAQNTSSSERRCSSRCLLLLELIARCFFKRKNN